MRDEWTPEPVDAVTSFPDLIRLYRAVVTERPIHADDVAREREASLGTHLSWMLDNMPDPAAEPLEFQRRLGFAQCLLWTLRYYTLNQMQGQTRSAAARDTER